MLSILRPSTISEDAADPSQEAQHLRRILDALPAAVYATDPFGRITYYNRAAAELAGREPMVGRDEWCVTFRLFTQDGQELPHDQCPMAVALREERPIRGVEALAQRPDGSLFPFLPFPTPFYDDRGRLAGAVNLLVDVSERKQAEANQRTLLNELNHRVKNNMQMLYSLLLSAGRDAESEEARSVLADASHRVAAMAAAQRLLYSENDPRAVRADDLLHAICDAARQACANQIDIRVDAETRRLPNDTAQPLALILNELLTNAIKHGVGRKTDGEITIGLRCHGPDIVLSVEDNGPGFEMTASRRYASGLGLVRGLAGQLGGDFTVLPGARCIVRFPEARAR